MWKRLIIFFFILACLVLNTKAQPKQKIDQLILQTEQAKNDASKISSYGKLAELYFIYHHDQKGDSILRKKLKTAEFSNRKELILEALFGDEITLISSYRSSETFDLALDFINKGLSYAKEIASEEYICISYIRLAGIYRKRGQIDNAFYNANFAFTSSQNISNDSIKILAAIELGDTYQAKGESLLAFKTYTNAYDRSVEIENYMLQSDVLHRFSYLYAALGNNVAAKENLISSIELNKEHKNTEGLIKDYIDLSRLTDEREYVDMALRLAQKSNLERHIIRSKKILYGYYTYIIANSDSTLNFINRNPDLKQLYLNEGSAKYQWIIGSIFHYSNQPDSAIYYFNLAEAGFNTDFDSKSRQALYDELGDCYQMNKDYKKAIYYFEKANALNNEEYNIGNAANYAEVLSTLYNNLEDYKKAFFYSKKSITLNDSIQKLANLRDITLIEVNNEKKKHELEMAIVQQTKIKKRNIQYMAITIAVSVMFLFMIIIGLFPISRISIKMMGYFAFISLFEFFIVVFDSIIHEIAHGEPLKIWLCKVLLIALLVPFQHYLEHGMIRFLESSKFKNFRNKINIKNWIISLKKTKKPSIDEIEEDTAVL